MTKPKAINCIIQLVAFVLLIIPKGGVMQLKEYEKLDKAIAEAERTKRQIKYYEDKVKILEHKIPQLTRKERTHRLCTRGAMLEKYLQEPDLLTDEEIQEFLTRIFSLSGVERTLEIFLDMARGRILEENH